MAEQVAAESVTQAQLTEFVIRRLGSHRARNDVVFEVAKVGAMSWPEADAFVREVETQNQSRVALQQSPVLIIFAVGTLVVGLGLVFISMNYFVQLFNTGLMEVVVLNFSRDYRAVLMLITGIGMILGSFVGFWQLFQSLIPK